MSWAVGFDSMWKRDIGYGVPAVCDHPDCDEPIDRGLAHVCCDQQAYGGERGCGLFFCGRHSDYHGQCERCQEGKQPFMPKPDTPDWTHFKATDPSWAKWRETKEIL